MELSKVRFNGPGVPPCEELQPGSEEETGWKAKHKFKLGLLLAFIPEHILLRGLLLVVLLYLFSLLTERRGHEI